MAGPGTSFLVDLAVQCQPKSFPSPLQDYLLVLPSPSRHRVVPRDTEGSTAERNPLQSPGMAMWKVKPSVGA